MRSTASVPKIAIIENVRGALYRNRDYLCSVIRELERFGYALEVRVLNAAHYGVPQRRERLVIVASTVGWQWPDPLGHGACDGRHRTGSLGVSGGAFQ